MSKFHDMTTSISIKKIVSSFSLPFVALSMLLIFSCNKDDDYLNDASATPLTFSVDTLSVDTVFTTLGSTTRTLMVYNRGSHPVRLSSVAMQQGRTSRFRLNVDGDTALVARDIRLAAADSMFIFVQATIDPNDASSPFLVEDAIVFDIDGCSSQQVVVTAYGRNAVYHIPTDTANPTQTDRYGNLYRYSVIDCETWDHTRPHVIVGYAVVDSAATLQLTAGDELYFDRDAVLWIYKDGALSVQGTEEQPVLFTSLRHDGWYATLPAQWGHIWLGGISGSSARPCTIDHAIIENAYYGIIVDSNAYSQPALTITNTILRHHKIAALQLDETWTIGNHLLLYNCGGATIYAPFGGRLQFDHITSANYWHLDHRATASIILSNYYESVAGHITRPLLEASFTNSIIFGSRADGEIDLQRDESAPFNTSFDDCFIHNVGDSYNVPMFVDIDNDDYHLLPTSPAIGLGYYPDPVADEETTK